MENNELNNFEPIKEKKSNKGIIIVLVVLLLISLGVGGYFGYKYFTNKPSSEQNQSNNNANQANNNTNNQTNTNNNSTIDNTIKEVTLSNDEKEFLDKVLFPVNFYANEYTKEYINDYTFKYRVIEFLAMKDLSYDEYGINGVEVTGAARFKYNDYASYYKKAFNEDFDINKVNADDADGYPAVKDGYIYTSYISGATMGNEHFEFKKAMYDEKNKEYIIELEYFNLGEYIESTDTFTHEVLGKATFKYVKNNDNRVFKSFIITK